MRAPWKDERNWQEGLPYKMMPEPLRTLAWYILGCTGSSQAVLSLAAGPDELMQAGRVIELNARKKMAIEILGDLKDPGLPIDNKMQFEGYIASYIKQVQDDLERFR